jgi:hypothetical protein
MILIYDAVFSNPCKGAANMSGYFIYASVHDGKPALQVIEADSQRTCLVWEGREAQPELSDQDLRELFRRLLLLTCRQKLKSRIAAEHSQGSLD